MQSVTGGTVREDGNVYYVIGSADGKGEFLVRCKTIGQRNQLKGKGICFVDEAYKGDSTVGTGWAMYLTVGTSTTTTSPVWVKIAEQESVEGAWNLQQELIKSLVKITTFTSHQQSNDAEFKKIWNKIAQIGSFDNHSHNNKALLDNLTDASGQLKYKGKPINGSVYVYNEGADSNGTGLKWINPVDETITSGGHTSDDIARLFIGTSVAYPGQTLRVVNLDKSVSTYLVVGDDDNLTTVFLGRTSACENERRVRFVTALPIPSASYTNELFYVLPPSYNGDSIGHFYICKIVDDPDVYGWIDVSLDNSSVTENGAEILVCFKTKWNTVKIMFKNPSVNAHSNGETSSLDLFGRTYIVRKFGSAPENKNDGEVIKVSTDSTEELFTDITPLTKEDVYYGVFSETINGRAYQNSPNNTSKAEFLTWSIINRINDFELLDSVLEIGDTVILPHHSEFGKISCEVIDYNGKLALYAKNPIGNFVYDGIEYGKIPAEGTFKQGVTYYRLEVLIPGNEPYPRNVMLVRYNEMQPSEYTIGASIPENSGIFTGSGLNVTVHPNTSIGGIFGMALYANPDYQTSNINQWLNSDASAGGWFTPRDEYDTLDPTYESRDGFIRGFSDKEFLHSIGKIIIPEYNHAFIINRRNPMFQREVAYPGGVVTLPHEFERVYPMFILNNHQ